MSDHFLAALSATRISQSGRVEPLADVDVARWLVTTQPASRQWLLSGGTACSYFDLECLLD